MTDDAEGACSLDSKVEFLRRPGSYPDRVVAVQAIETHMSWVFLANGWAYKLKKPVHHPFLDFSTTGARRTDCEEELRLNQRLAPGIYQAVIALNVGPGGHLALGGPGEPVDWLVKMRRLPRERMLDAVLSGRELGREEVDALAESLADFYRQLVPVATSVVAYRDRLRHDIGACVQALGEYSRWLPAARVRPAGADLLGFVDEHHRPLAVRVVAGRIVEGHGDLRPEHVVMLERPVVIDCLEFNRELRVLDVADELAYLAMECARLGREASGLSVFATTTRLLGDPIAEALRRFYCGYRALVRAKIAAAHLLDPDITDAGKWQSRTMEYLELAGRYAGGGEVRAR